MVTRHPKFGHVRDFSFYSRGYMSCVYQISLEPTNPIWLAHTVQGPNCHKMIICHRDALVCGDEGTPNVAIYAIFNSTAGGNMSFMYQIDLGPADPIWLVHTLQGPNCNEIIIFHKDALVCGKEGTPNLGIYASPVCYYWGIGATCTKYPGTHNWGYR